MSIHQDIREYNAAQTAADKRICDKLARYIDQNLPAAENKIWHRHPVWFLNGNPIVGYHKLKNCVRLLFWSGQSFDEPGLAHEGTFKAAEARFTAHDQISLEDLQRWLKKSAGIQWDYKNIVKRKGKLVRIETGKKTASDWQSELIDQIRAIIQQADPEVVEEVKWRKPSNGMRGVPVWSHHGIVCTAETYKTTVKMTFAKGASLPDPVGLFNASLDGGTRRAVDFKEGDKIDDTALTVLIRAAVSLNSAEQAVKRQHTAKVSKAKAGHSRSRRKS